MEARVVVWIDKAVADFCDESIIIIESTGDVEMLRRMSRASFRAFIERSKRMLDAEDRRDQAEVRHIGGRTGH